MKSPFVVITLTFVIVMFVASSMTTVFSARHPVKIRFDTNTTIKDIVAVHNSGIPFDKYVAKISI
jgi:hypothetical protein